MAYLYQNSSTNTSTTTMTATPPSRKMSLSSASISPKSTLPTPPSNATLVATNPSQSQTASELIAVVAHFDPKATDPIDIYGLEVQLRTLKSLGRDPDISKMITADVTNDLINKIILTKLSKRSTTEALTIIANGLVLNNSLLSTFDPLPVFEFVLHEYSKPGLPLKENYLLGRLLFLFTFNGTDLSNSLLSYCIEIIQFKTSIILENVHTLTSVVAINTLIRLSFIELMKFIFNLIHHYPDKVTEPLESKVMENLSHIFLSINTSNLLNVDITRYLFHTLMCVSAESWFKNPIHQPLLLKNILGYCHLVTSPNHTNLHTEETLSPAFTCLQQVSTHIWEKNTGPCELKTIATSALLPTEKDREIGLGNSDSLASYFVKLSTDITLQSCNRIVQEIYWTLFDRNQQALNDVMGFGFAAGFLSSNSFLDDFGTSPTSIFVDTPRTRNNSVVDENGTSAMLENLPGSRRGSVASDASLPTPGMAINPITGQYLHTENQDERRLQAQQEWEAMTEEEKEIESERMFTLFDRLKKNGVIKPSNPVPIPQPTTDRVARLKS